MRHPPCTFRGCDERRQPRQVGKNACPLALMEPLNRWEIPVDMNKDPTNTFVFDHLMGRDILRQIEPGMDFFWPLPDPFASPFAFKPRGLVPPPPGSLRVE